MEENLDTIKPCNSEHILLYLLYYAFKIDNFSTRNILVGSLSTTLVSPVFGSYALHTDPKSEAILSVSQSVSQSVSMFEDKKTRDRSPRIFIIWQVDWGLVIPGCFVGHYCFQRVVVVVH